jgi:hypothetical protein
MSDAALTVRELVRQLGGPASVGRKLGVTAEAICNWQARGAVPKARHLDVWRLAQAAGLSWRPPGADGLALAPCPVSQAA